MKRHFDELVIDPSGLKTYIECPRRFMWNRVMDLVPDTFDHAPTFGAALHAGLLAWYELGDIDAAIVSFRGVWDDSRDEGKYTDAIGVAILRAYARRYPEEPFRFVALERSFKVPRKVRLLDIGEEIEINLMGRMDGLILWDNDYLIIDHKSSSRMGPTFFRRFRPDIQIWTYQSVSPDVFEVEASGMLINGILVAKTKQEFAREIIPMTDHEKSQFRHMLNTTVTQIRRDMTAWEKGNVDYADPTCPYFEQRWTACHKYNPCPYLPICQSNRPDATIEVEYIEHPWSPISDDEEVV